MERFRMKQRLIWIAAFVLTLWASHAHASIVHVSFKGTSAAGSGTSVCTGTQSHGAGHLLVATVINQSDNTSATVTNTANDTWIPTPKSPFQDGFVRNIRIF